LPQAATEAVAMNQPRVKMTFPYLLLIFHLWCVLLASLPTALATSIKLPLIDRMRRQPMTLLERGYSKKYLFCSGIVFSSLISNANHAFLSQICILVLSLTYIFYYQKINFNAIILDKRT